MDIHLISHTISLGSIAIGFLVLFFLRKKGFKTKNDLVDRLLNGGIFVIAWNTILYISMKFKIPVYFIAKDNLLEGTSGEKFIIIMMVFGVILSITGYLLNRAIKFFGKSPQE